MLFPAVLLDLGVDVLHQGVPLHQHVGEGGAGEDPHHLMNYFKNYNYKSNRNEKAFTVVREVRFEEKNWIKIALDSLELDTAQTISTFVTANSVLLYGN